MDEGNQASTAAQSPGQLPLAGRRIVVTRPPDQAGELAEPLRAMGAEVLVAPLIRIADPLDPRPLENAARDAQTFDWLVLTSANGAHRFMDAFEAAGGRAEELQRVGFCVIGPATEEALRKRGIQANLVASTHLAEGVVSALSDATDIRGKRVLLPQAEGAREILARALEALGAEVSEVIAYRTLPTEGAEGLAEELAEGRIDMVTFTSGSAVRNFVDRYGADTGTARVAVIGPITAAVARDVQLPVDVEAEPYTAPGLVDAIRRWYAADGR